jgi:hypothetical protein
MDSVPQNEAPVAQQPLKAQTRPLTTVYAFLHNKLMHCMTQANKIPLTLVTVLHIQMFEMTERCVTKSTDFEVVG